MPIRSKLARILPKSLEGLAVLTALVMMICLLMFLSIGMFITRMITPEIGWIPMGSCVVLAIVTTTSIIWWFDTCVEKCIDLKAPAATK